MSANGFSIALDVICGMSEMNNLVEDLLLVWYPHHCRGCGSDILSREQLICLSCLNQLPHTGFATLPNNPVEKIFRGRVQLKAVHSEFYFSKGQLIQTLIHALKYHGDQDMGVFLGSCVGSSLLGSGRFQGLDGIMALPLYPDKEYARGYNQAALIAKGISEVMMVPFLDGALIRQKATETQTRKNRLARWENVRNSFRVTDERKIRGQNLLLVDDVITTGATLEACADVLLQIPGTTVSLASVAHAEQ